MKERKNITILTGAGISAESGIPTFRAKEGLWHDHRIEDVATPEGFTRNPELVHTFYNMRRHQLLTSGVKPNAAHLALARLEKEYPGNVHIITQNIDNLHERAGSHHVIHMHGELLKVRCSYCDAVVEWEKDLSTKTECPKCLKQGGMRPHVVWFREIPLHMPQIERILVDTGTFIAIGTSGVVYPAAGFVALAKSFGAKSVEINLDLTEVSGLFDRSIQGKATEQVPRLIEEILGN